MTPTDQENDIFGKYMDEFAATNSDVQSFFEQEQPNALDEIIQKLEDAIARIDQEYADEKRHTQQIQELLNLIKPRLTAQELKISETMFSQIAKLYQEIDSLTTKGSQLAKYTDGHPSERAEISMIDENINTKKEEARRLQKQLLELATPHLKTS